MCETFFVHRTIKILEEYIMKKQSSRFLSSFDQLFWKICTTVFLCDTCIWLSTGIQLLISLRPISYLVSHLKWSEILQKKVQCIKKLTVLTHLFCRFLIKSIWEWERDVKFIGYNIYLFNYQYTFLWKIMCMKLSIFDSRIHMFSYTWWALSRISMATSDVLQNLSKTLIY